MLHCWLIQEFLLHICGSIFILHDIQMKFIEEPRNFWKDSFFHYFEVFLLLFLAWHSVHQVCYSYNAGEMFSHLTHEVDSDTSSLHLYSLPSLSHLSKPGQIWEHLTKVSS